MQVKCLLVQANSKDKDLAALVEKTVNQALSDVDGKDVVVDVKPDLTGVLGKALVTISFLKEKAAEKVTEKVEKAEKKEEKKKEK